NMLIDPIRQYRLLEMIPGMRIWSTSLGTIVHSFIKPLRVISFILVFALLWLLRVLYFVLFIFVGWRRYRQDSAQDWSKIVPQMAGADELYHLIILPTYEEPFEVLDSSIQSYKSAKYDKSKMIIVI